MNITNTYSIENTKRTGELIVLLTNWYEKSSRDLIWRKTREPYAIWISEIMAQQTRITAVLPYYERFISRFPTVEALADAPSDDVLKAWEGLGYYSRAHNLLKTAKIITEQYEGRFPENPELLKSLPGIGDYTAGAIASICFNLPTPAVDGNVLRVFARLENNDMDIAHPATKKLLTDYVKNMMPYAQAGIFNQALMELGALICIPKNPLCGNCPVVSLCEAYHSGKQNELPVKSTKKEIKNIDKTILIIINPKHEILMRQRNEKLLNGLWIFYMPEKAVNKKEIKNHLKCLNYTIKALLPIGPASHTFTHIKWHMQGYICEIEETSPLNGYEFISLEEMGKRAMPTAVAFYKEWLLGKTDFQISLDFLDK